MITTRILILAAVVTVLGMVELVNAGFLGHDIRAQSEWDNGVRDTRYVTVVDPGVEITDFPSQNGWDIDITDTTISIGKLDWAIYLDAQFNGTRFNDYTESIPAILDVQISSTDIYGMDPSRITFDENNISVNYAELSMVGDEHLILDVTFVPEPASAVLLALGGMSIIHRRKRQPISHCIVVNKSRFAARLAQPSC